MSEILFGIHPVLEALRARRRRFVQIWVNRNKLSPGLRELSALADARGVDVEKVPATRLQSMAGTPQHQGVAAKVGLYPWVDFAQLLPVPLGPGGSAFFLLLDGILDPQNLGAIARTALCAGIDGVVTAQDRCAPPTPAASKASAGALEHLRVARVPNLVHALCALKDRGLWVAGMAPSAGPVLFDMDLNGPLALVVGSEEKGIRPLVRRHCDFLFCIPQAGPLDSLNASVACGVALYEAFRQRRMR